MALRNTARRPARFILSVGLLAAAGSLFVAGMSAGDGVESVSAQAKEERTWDVVVQLSNATAVGDIERSVMALRDVTLAEGWTMVESSVASVGEIPVTRTYPDQGHGRLGLTAIPTGTQMFVQPKTLEGRWLLPGEKDAIVLNQVALATTDIDARIGDPVELTIGGRPTTWVLVGVSLERGAHSGAYVTAEGLADATGKAITANTIRIATSSSDETTRTRVATEAQAALERASIGVRSAGSVARSDAIQAGHLGPIIAILLATALPMAIIGLLGLASTMGANVLERTREFGIMHALGASPAAVRRIVVTEGVITALASCVVAVLPALALTALMGIVLGNAFMYAPLPYTISMFSTAIWIALVIVGAILATEAAATRAAKITVREALAYE